MILIFYIHPCLTESLYRWNTAITIANTTSNWLYCSGKLPVPIDNKSGATTKIWTRLMRFG